VKEYAGGIHHKVLQFLRYRKWYLGFLWDVETGTRVEIYSKY
jgi:hypothetical protein